MANLIQSATTSNISVTNLTIADKSGSGNCTWSTPVGASMQFNGMRLNTENRTSSYVIDLEKSGRIWTNTGAGAITASLPSGAPQGWFAMFQRTGGILTIQPGANDKLIYGDDANVKSDGVAGTIATSGGFMCVMSDVNNNWTRFLYGGTIT